MKAKDMIEYFSKYDPESDVMILAADPKARKKFGGQVFMITDCEQPVMCMEIHTSEDLDAEEVAAAEEDERAAEEAR